MLSLNSPSTTTPKKVDPYFFRYRFPLNRGRSPTIQGGNSWKNRSRGPLVAFHVHIDGKRTNFLDQDVERFRHAGLDLVLALDDVLVHLRASIDVVGLDREHFLERIRRAVGLERPDFHFAEALASELRLTTQRLLRDPAVRPRRAGVHF